MPLAAMIAIPAIGSIAGGLIAKSGANNAANAQIQAANTASATQDRATQAAIEQQKAALDFSKQIYGDEVTRQKPFYDAGVEATHSLQDFVKDPSNIWNKNFTAPAYSDLQNDPAYMGGFNLGQQAIERSALAKTGLSGGTLKSLNKFGQDYGSAKYGELYARAKGEYETAYNQFQQQTSDKFNRLASLAGFGQTSAGELNSAAGTLAGQNQSGSAGIANTLMGGAQNIANLQTQAGNARASGYVGGANAIGGAIGGASNSIGNMLALSQMGLFN